MKSRYSSILLILTVAAFLSVNFLQMTKAENKKTNETEQLKKVSTTTDSTETKTLTAAQKAIPDEIALEVFLRTVGENNAPQLLQKAGLDENVNSNKIQRVLASAKLFNDNLDRIDKQSRRIKNLANHSYNSDFLKDSNVKSDLTDLQSEKKNIVKQFIAGNLAEANTSDNGWKELQNYVQTIVKSEMQIVSVKSASQAKQHEFDIKKAAFANSFTKKSAAQTQVGDAYLYITEWNDLDNVFGSGMISEQYSSGTSYLVSVTVTSPGGRTNTTSGDWNYATLSNSTGLSSGVEDGIYNIQANFDADAGGYYDEWGNYNSYGTYNVGSLTSSITIPPFVKIESATIEPSQFQLSGNPEGGQGTGIITLGIRTSDDVPIGTTLVIGLSEKANGTNNSDQVQYTVMPLSPDGHPEPSPITSNRRVTKKVSDFGQLKFYDVFSVTMTATSNRTGTVTNEVYISRIMTKADGTNSEGVSGEGSSQDAAFTLSPRPTPSPSVSPTPTVTPTPEYGGGGYGGGCGACSHAGLGCIGCANYGAPGTFQGCRSPFFNYSGCCCQGSPIILDINGDGYAMTDGANGVSFDINGDGRKDQTSWTAANSDDAWLVLDRNDNHTIDDGKEMFGNYCDQPAPPAGTLRNGFTGLAEFDKPANGGNSDGKITRADAVFKKLRLWQDKNHNGISEQEELSRLPALDVVAIFLDYKESKRTDEFGNRFKFRAKVRDAKGAKAGRWAWDVFVNPPTH